jgi:hypothetical protein
MPLVSKLVRTAALLGILVAALAGSSVAGAATSYQSAPAIAPEVPDCYSGPCTRILGPGQRLVLGDRLAFTSADASGLADGFGARFVVKHSYDGVNFTKIYETAPGQPSFRSFYGRSLTPWLFPGYFRVIAINDATWLISTRVTLNLRTF